MIKRTLYFGNPAYLSLRNAQLVLRLPEVVKNDTLSAVVKNHHYAGLARETDGKQLCRHHVRQHAHACRLVAAARRALGAE